MINQQIIDFIKGQLSKGLTKGKITSDLLASGWTAQDVEEGFKEITSPTQNIVQNNNVVPSSSKPKGFFFMLHILVILSFVFGFIVALMTLLQIILPFNSPFEYFLRVSGYGSLYFAIIVIPFFWFGILDMAFFLAATFNKKYSKYNEEKFYIVSAVILGLLIISFVVYGILMFLQGFGAGMTG